MMYLHDLWVNFGRDVSLFHEWKKEDNVCLIDQAPLLYVTEMCFEWIVKTDEPLPQELMEHVRKRAYYRKKQERVSSLYCFVICDGRRVMAIETDNTDYPKYRSSLLPRHERIALSVIGEKGREQKHYGYNIPIPQNAYRPQLSFEQAAGLTRTEREKKQQVLNMLTLYEGNAPFLCYIYGEWKEMPSSEVKQKNLELLHKELVSHLKVGWDDTHERLYKVFENMKEVRSSQ
ncbi:DUF3603 family protein (plasmid) [Pontibacillus sp. ALD_SL1]|uniref:DUF3603 family protein n=1 Tax=Pontibacillus sp. ALD_SL1 TaxID=2777185 RepID=UPI001A957E2A|nr:DUF3603 family protein [Pontibacillus sp. ALD_SL1]QST02269.1 DUF3603 family protein [Pontibacillus sp. ALD_SL1]